MRNHKKWLKSQNPIGTWVSEIKNIRILLEFEGGPKEGTYKQIEEKERIKIKEFGHWKIELNKLEMIIMATDIKEHPRFGQNTIYQINYIGPTSINIDGPDRSNLIFEKTTEKIPFNKD